MCHGKPAHTFIMKRSQILALVIIVAALTRAEPLIEKSSGLPDIIKDQASAETFPEHRCR
jgi:hypothetical protein